MSSAQTFAADKTPAKSPAKTDAKVPTAPAEAWTVRCDKPKDADAKKDAVEAKDDNAPKRGRCEIFQRLVVKETGQRFAEFAIGFPKDKATARGIIVAPLGILLSAGMMFKIDDGQAYKFEARYCDAGGCYAYVDLTDAILDAMSKGTKMTLSFQALNQKVMNIEMSLKDFGPALQKVK